MSTVVTEPVSEPESRAGLLSGLQRGVLLVTLALGSLVIVPGLTDPVMLPKATLLAFGAIVLVLLTGVRLLTDGRLQLPRSRALALLAGLLVGMALVTLASEDAATSALGRLTRYGGLVEYASYAVLMAAVALLYRVRSVVSLTRTLSVVLVLLLGYGLAQLLGYDYIDWNSGRDDPWFSTMGNTNFASAYVGILVPVLVSVALMRGARSGWRVASALLAVVGFGYTVALAAIQGPLIALAGSALVVAAAVGDPRWLLRRVGRSRRLSAAAILGAVLATPVVVRLVVFAVQDVPPSLYGRTLLWRAAGSMFVANPVTGTGLDGFGDHFFASRPLVHAATRGTAVADAPHQVPLGMFAHGGLLLGLVYLAFVVTIGVVLVRGLRRTSGDTRLVLAGYGGAWVAYQMQSLVSIDVPPVAVLHFLTAGVIVALAAPPRTMPLGGVLRPKGLRVTAATLVALLIVPATPQILRPLEADVAAAVARDAARDGDKAEALDFAQRAVELMPYEPSYRRALGKRLVSVDGQRALAELERAAELEAGSVSYLRDVVAQAQRLADAETERRWNAELLRRDPWNSFGLSQQARLALQEGRFADARDLYERRIRLDPDDVEPYYALAEVHAANGDLDAARQTYERLVAERPREKEEAGRRLAELGGA